MIANLQYLKLPHIREEFAATAKQASSREWGHIQYLADLIEGEAHKRQDRAIQRLIKTARIPVIKTMDQFQWSWPAKINRLQINNLFRLAFLGDKANVILLGGVGLGKTHLSIALGHAACMMNERVDS
ncbi:MAG: ATP-binding protein [Magnetococcales bacterium]|nr:ATP-binding protein [Magnetococcales bacterium]